MRFFYTIAAILAASPAYAMDREALNQSYPTVTEIYEDCKAAVALSDAGHMKEFYNTGCAIRISATISAVTATLMVIPVAATTDKDRIEMDLIKTLWQRWCVLKELDKNKPLEPQLAERYVVFYERHKDEYNFKKYLDERNSFAIQSAFSDSCTAEQP